MSRAFAAPTVREALDSALVALQGAGLDTPRLDAEVLLAHALGTDRLRLLLDRDAPVDGAAARWFRDAVRARTVQRMPVAYLTGTKGFWDVELTVDPRVLIPRPETETLVEWALEALPRGSSVVDVGTGSGAIALALAPHFDVRATDVSEDALAVARANAERLGRRVAFAVGDLRVDDAEAIVANPPYVERGAQLAPELAHEPHLALFGGEDGLDVVRRLVVVAAAAPARVLALEVGAGQAPGVRDLAERAGFARTEVRRDLAGHDRVVVAWR